jgi:hypothetical protein
MMQTFNKSSQGIKTRNPVERNLRSAGKGNPRISEANLELTWMVVERDLPILKQAVTDLVKE